MRPERPITDCTKQEDGEAQGKEPSSIFILVAAAADVGSDKTKPVARLDEWSVWHRDNKQCKME